MIVVASAFDIEVSRARPVGAETSGEGSTHRRSAIDGVDQVVARIGGHGGDAWDFHPIGKLDEREQPVPACAWFKTEAGVDVIEHSICSVEHGTVLSMLWVPEAVAAPLGML